MRSRYSAYVLGHTDHLFRSWHPRTRPDDLTLTPMTWLGLEIVGVEDGAEGDSTGVVEFVARFRGSTAVESVHEISTFERRGGRWVYVDGSVS